MTSTAARVRNFRNQPRRPQMSPESLSPCSLLPAPRSLFPVPRSLISDLCFKPALKPANSQQKTRKKRPKLHLKRIMCRQARVISLRKRRVGSEHFTTPPMHLPNRRVSVAVLRPNQLSIAAGKHCACKMRFQKSTVPQRVGVPPVPRTWGPGIGPPPWVVVRWVGQNDGQFPVLTGPLCF